MHSVTRPGLALLLACMQKETPSGIRSLAAKEIPWPGLLDLAQRHKLTPLLYWCLKKADCLDRVSPPEASRLLADYHFTLVRNLRLRETYDEVSAHLSKAGIIHCPLRGIDWAFSLYESPGLRPMSDIDLLVAPESKTRSREVLEKAGFRHQQRERFTPHHDIVSRDGHMVEVHFRITDEAVVSLIPNFRVSPQAPASLPNLQRPLAALHYWMKPESCALWISDYLRLPTVSAVSLTAGARLLMQRTERVIEAARTGNYTPLFFSAGRPYFFWARLLGGCFLRSAIGHPSAVLRIGAMMIRWQRRRLDVLLWRKKRRKADYR